jgi:hypothetical protein
MSFVLVYGSEAILPYELKVKPTRVHLVGGTDQEQQRIDDLNVIKEACEVALVREATYQQALRRLYEKTVKKRSFKVGNLILRLIQSNVGKNKVSSKWEGPYHIVGSPRPGAYYLEKDDIAYSNTWNLVQLRRSYP